MDKYGDLGPAVGRVYGEMLKMSGLARLTKAQKNAALNPHPAAWQDAIFVQLVRGLSEEQIVGYLKEKLQTFKTFAGHCVWDIFRELERTSIYRLDKRHDEQKAERHAAEVAARPQKGASKIETLCWAIRRRFPGGAGLSLACSLASIRGGIVAGRLTVDEGRERLEKAIATLGLKLSDEQRGRLFTALEESDGEGQGVRVQGLCGRGKSDGEDGRDGSADRRVDGGARRPDE